MENEHNVASFPARLRTPPLALRNVVHGGRRTLAAISGVAFSLTMVLLQLGFLEAVKITAANNFEQVDFDIVLLSPRYEQFYAAGYFPLDRLKLARSLETVVSAAPMYGDVQPLAMSRIPGRSARRRIDRPGVARSARAAGSRGRSFPGRSCGGSSSSWGSTSTRTRFESRSAAGSSSFEPLLRLSGQDPAQRALPP